MMAPVSTAAPAPASVCGGWGGSAAVSLTVVSASVGASGAATAAGEGEVGGQDGW